MATRKQLTELPSRSMSTSIGVPLFTERRRSVSDGADLTIPPQPSPTRLTPPHAGLYTVNSLSSYSFGSVQPSHSPPTSIDPLSQEDDHEPRRVDITPRPSVVEHGEFGGNRPQHFFRSHSSQSPGRSRNPLPLDPAELDNRLFNPDPPRARSSDAASHRTFGTSSASASVTSLSSIGHQDSRMSDRSASTRHTSAANTDDEDDRTNLDFSSDDEYDEEYYENDDSAYRVEISSTVYEEGSPDESSSFAWDSGSRVDLSYDRRRGSLPMAIPGVGEGRTDERGRDREDSLITLRRPSRSLDDDLSILNLHVGPATIGGSNIDPLGHSVPGTDSDWRNIANKQRLMASRGSITTLSTIRDSRYTNLTPTTARANPSTVTDGFDQDWLDMMRGGITSIPTSDFVRQPQDPQSAGRSSIFGLRRPSVASVMTYDDPFLKAVGRWDSQGYGAQRKEWTFKRETVDSSGPSHTTKPTGNKFVGLLGSRTSIDRDRVGPGSITSSKSISIEDKERREKDREKERRLPANWKGMAIGAGEVWGNILIGRYEVTRTTSTPSDPNKGPQQRLSIMHFSDDRTKLRHKSPPVTVHKHSKAIAYSISRFYRLRFHQPQDDRQAKTTTPRDSSYPRPPPSRDGSVISSKTSATYTRSKGSTTMILLAPRRVQEDYTNTTTTRKLESHGLLDEQGRNARDKSQTRKEKDRDKDRKRKPDDSKKGKESTRTEREQMSSSGSVASSTLAPAPSMLAPDLTPDRLRRRRRSIDSSSDEENVSHRTPHSETYSTVDPGVIEHLRPTQLANDDPGLFRRMWRGNRVRTAPIAAGNYTPPWMIMTSRNELEEQQRMVKNLSTSFAGVGLLPPTKDKGHSNSQKQKRKEVSSSVDIFDEMEPDTLFMILPMWPGETDPKSRSKSYQRPEIPLHERLYLILSYRTNSTQKSQSDGKKVRSPTSSADSRDDRTILLSAFYISARIVRYRELMGSGMRVPDEGLAISGPLDEAYRSIPCPNPDMQVIGNCSSRESGIEFIPEGLVCLGLCKPSLTLSEISDDAGPLPEPTPIGRAVMEMAFIGGMALTSFGSITS